MGIFFKNGSPNFDLHVIFPTMQAWKPAGTGPGGVGSRVTVSGLTDASWVAPCHYSQSQLFIVSITDSPAEVREDA